MRDLEPFVCILTHPIESKPPHSCLYTFGSSRVWLRNMLSVHGATWECRAPSHDLIVFETEEDYQEHARKAHEVPEEYMHKMSALARRPLVASKIKACPFGDEFSAPEEAESNPVFITEALHQHVATHLKEIALLTLQKFPRDDNDNSEDVGSYLMMDDKC